MIRTLSNFFHGTPLIYVVKAVVEKEDQTVIVETYKFYPRWVYLKCKSIFIHDELFFREKDTSKLKINGMNDQFAITLHSLDYGFEDRRFLLRFSTRSKKLYSTVNKFMSQTQSTEENTSAR